MTLQEKIDCRKAVELIKRLLSESKNQKERDALNYAYNVELLKLVRFYENGLITFNEYMYLSCETDTNYCEILENMQF